MARKLKPDQVPPRVEPIPVAGSEPLTPPPMPDVSPLSDDMPRRKPGRPSKAELEARRQAQLEESKLTPRDMLPVTTAFLNTLSVVIKGDAPVEQEIDGVNSALVAVANKHGGRIKYWEEIMLALAMGTTVLGMKGRAKERERIEREAARRASGLGPEGLGQVLPGPFVPPPGIP